MPALSHRSVVVIAAGVLVALLCAGCATKDPLLGHGRRVVSVRFEGVKRFKKRALLRHLHLAETGWSPFAKDIPYDEAVLAVDRRRVEALYRSYGYLRARVTEADRGCRVVVRCGFGRADRRALGTVSAQPDCHRFVVASRHSRWHDPCDCHTEFSMLSVRLDKETEALLDATVALQKRSRSDVIREALRHYLGQDRELAEFQRQCRLIDDAHRADVDSQRWLDDEADDLFARVDAQEAHLDDPVATKGASAPEADDAPR